ncbi:MAG TPA: glycine cleavage system protein GcvH [Acidimicrobiia bacterium]|nr:glycine cleavage system protein GcvH [Acidimicrobiia bacterium]
MATVSNCNLPEDLYYVVEKHVWASHADGIVTVGLTDVAQNLAKGIISVSPKKVGRKVESGKSVATVESSKWVGPVPCPVNGEIVEINEGAVSDPGIINREPYGAGWIAKVRANDWAADSANLATGEAAIAEYSAFLEKEGITCGS